MRKVILVFTLYSLLLGIVCFPVSTISANQPQSVKKELITVETDEAQTERAQYALLVGINSYKEFSPLNGCENDVRIMKDLLVKQYGFKEDAKNKAKSDTQTLLSAEATRANILKSFEEQLINKAEAFFKASKLNGNTKNKGANVVFYYSGHGATFPDIDKKTGKLAGEEADGLDETIVPIDAKSDGTNAIIDDEFDAFYEKLSRWTTNITFIFDSCHSGTVSRAGALSRRAEFTNYQLPAAIAKEFAASQVNGRGVGDDEYLTDGFNDAAQKREELGYVTVSGCLPNQLSQENLLPNPDYDANDQRSAKMLYNGLLTYFLVQQLKSNKYVTYRDIMKNVQNAVRLKNPSQLPQFEGDLDKPFLNIQMTRSNVRINAKAISFENQKDLTIKLGAGKILGAFEGGIIAIYSRDAMKMTGDDERIGSGTIISSDDFSATVKISLKDANLKEVPANSQITLVTPYFGSAKRLIALDTSPAKQSDSAKIMREVAGFAKNDKFAATKEIKLPFAVKREMRDWDAAIVRTTYKDFKFGNKQAAAANAPKDDEEIYILADQNDMPLYNFFVPTADENAAQKIAKAMEKHVRVENIRTFGNGAGELNDKIKLEIVPITSSRDSATGVCSISEIPTDERVKQNNVEMLTPGQQFYFKITNNTGENMYVYLYDIAPDGSVSLLFPDKRRNIDELLDDGITLNTYAHQKSNCYVFRVTSPEKTAAPYGIETFKLIATTQKINAQILESAAIAAGERDGTSPLGQLLAQASTNELKARSESVSFDFGGWATTSVDIEIREK